MLRGEDVEPPADVQRGHASPASARSSTDRSCQNWSRLGWDSSSDHHGQTFSSTGWWLGGSALQGAAAGRPAWRSGRPAAAGRLRPGPAARSASASAIWVDHDWIECQDKDAAVGVPRGGVVVGRGNAGRDRPHPVGRRSRWPTARTPGRTGRRCRWCRRTRAGRAARRDGVGAVVRGSVQHRGEVAGRPERTPAVLVDHPRSPASTSANRFGTSP